jgi:hypothetical protein
VNAKSPKRYINNKNSKQQSPKPGSIVRIGNKLINKNFIKSGTTIVISFSPLFEFDPDYDNYVYKPLHYSELPKPVQDEVLKYFKSDFTKNDPKFGSKLLHYGFITLFNKYIAGYQTTKTKILKIKFDMGFDLTVKIYCQLTSIKPIDINEYKRNIIDGLYKASWSGPPTVSKYGKYLGEGEGRYGININNNVQFMLKQ